MRLILSTALLAAYALLVASCDDDPKPGPPPIAGDESAETSTTGDSVPADCRVLFGCLQACELVEPNCAELCEQHAGDDAVACYEWQCETSRAGCFAGDADACAEIPIACGHADGSESGSVVTGSSEGSSIGSSDSDSNSNSNSNSSSDESDSDSTSTGDTSGTDASSSGSEATG